MSKISKGDYKKLVAQNKTEQLIENLLTHLGQYLTYSKQDHTQRLYNVIIQLSGQWEGVKQEINLNILDERTARLRKNQITQALLGQVDSLPSNYFAFLNGDKKRPVEQPDLRQKVNEFHQKSHFEYDAFLSFSSKDLEEARQVCAELRGHGLRVFLSDEVLKANTGASFNEKIDFALSNSQHFILLSSVNSMASEWVQIEYETFFNECHIKNRKQRRFIILRGKGFNRSHVPTIYRRLQFATTPKEILNTFVKDIDLQQRQQEKQAKERQQQEATRQKQEAEKIRLAQIAQQKQAATQQKAEQARLEQLALQEIRAKKAQEKRARKSAEKEKWWAENRNKLFGGLLGVVFLILGVMILPSLFDGCGSAKEDDAVAKIEQLPAVENQDSLAALKNYQNLLVKAQNLLDKEDFTAAQENFQKSVSAIGTFNIDIEAAEAGIKTCQVELGKLAKQQEEQQKQKEDEKRKSNNKTASEKKKQESPAPSKKAPSLILQTLENNMKSIPSGSFTMGCTSEQKNCDDDEKELTDISIRSFKMNKYEVTQEEWKAVMGNNPSSNEGCDKCPVERVNWNDIQDFLKKLNKITGKNYRLPSEAEWEYAARGNEKNLYAGSSSIGSVAWYGENSGSKTHPVGGKKSNGFGLYDMSGNVWEWCQDCWNKTYEGRPTNNSAWTSGNCSVRVLRGGSWDNYGKNCRVSNRYYSNPDYRYSNYGFRLAHS